MKSRLLVPLIFCAASSVAVAQGYPNKVIQLQVPSVAARFENRQRSPDDSNYKQVFRTLGTFYMPE